MVSAPQLLTLAGFALVASITPGPNNLMLMASGTNFGFQRTLPHMFGVNLGFSLMLFLVGIGLMGLMAEAPLFFVALQVVAIGYLLYLAFRLATASEVPGPESSASEITSQPLSFFQAALFQWVNPKAWTMALTANTAFAQPDSVYLGVLVIVVVFSFVNLPSISVWTLAGTQLRALLNTPTRLRVFNIAAALVLVASVLPGALYLIGTAI